MEVFHPRKILENINNKNTRTPLDIGK